jgi:hypothetical protein
MKNGAKDPSYLPSRTFSTAVMDLVTAGKQAAITFEDLQDGIRNLPDGDVKDALLALIRNANGSLDRAQKNIEAWFDDCMDRLSGWYKRRVQIFTVIIAALLTIAANADTIRITRTLWNSPELRAEGVKLAEQRANQESAPSHKVQYNDKNKPLQPTIAPIKPEERKYLNELFGWKQDANPSPLGLLLTIIAVSLGAPFWFDILNKFINIRNTGRAPDEAPKTPEQAKPTGAALNPS